MIVLNILFTLFMLAVSGGLALCAVVMVVSVNPYPLSERRSDLAYVAFYALMVVWCFAVIAEVWT